VLLEESQWVDRAGNAITLQLPSVNRELCIGCGIGKHQCLLNGEAAIRVYVAGT